MTSPPQAIDLGFVNAYLFTTDAGFILVDTGMRSQRGALKKHWRARVASRGVCS